MTLLPAVSVLYHVNIYQSGTVDSVRTMSATVEISEDDGEFTAVDHETGISGVGSSRALALAALAVELGSLDGPDAVDPVAGVDGLADRTRRRFEVEGVTDDDVEDAIAWARSE